MSRPKKHGLIQAYRKLTKEEVEGLGYFNIPVTKEESKCTFCMCKVNHAMCNRVICTMSYWKDYDGIGLKKLKKAYNKKKAQRRLMGLE